MPLQGKRRVVPTVNSWERLNGKRARIEKPILPTARSRYTYTYFVKKLGKNVVDKIETLLVENPDKTYAEIRPNLVNHGVVFPFSESLFSYCCTEIVEKKKIDRKALKQEKGKPIVGEQWYTHPQVVSLIVELMEKRFSLKTVFEQVNKLLVKLSSKGLVDVPIGFKFFSYPSDVFLNTVKKLEEQGKVVVQRTKRKSEPVYKPVALTFTEKRMAADKRLSTEIINKALSKSDSRQFIVFLRSRGLGTLSGYV
ncbi:MAG: hypothetical protein Q7K42_03230, partial [Candidatus Diapherotrites archaeon]|nr:hypothetical protein [Candidatus Diapherotrites archaeon]